MQMPLHIVAVLGYVENNNNEILLVKTHREGEWVFPGGQVENGENLIDGVIREVKEESGIDVKVSKLVGIFSNTAQYKGHSGVDIVPTKLMMDFVCEPTGGEFTANPETSESRWIKKDKVLDFVTAPALRTRFESYLEYNGNVNYKEYITKPEFELKLDREI